MATQQKCLGPDSKEIAEDLADILFAFTDTNIDWDYSTIITTTITTTDNFFSQKHVAVESVSES